MSEQFQRDNIWDRLGNHEARIGVLEAYKKERDVEIDRIAEAYASYRSQNDKHLNEIDTNLAKLSDAVKKQSEEAVAVAAAKQLELEEHKKARQSTNERIWAILAAVLLAVGQRALVLVNLPHPYELVLSVVFGVGLVLLVVWLLLQRPKS